MTKKRTSALLALVLVLALAVGMLPTAVFAADEAPANTEAAYVLMNIPYDEFYAAELGEKDDVDAVTSATLKGKARNVNVNGASYHQSEEAVTTEGIAGVRYPVLVTDMEALKSLGGKAVTDADKISYEMSARGQTSTVELTGAGTLAEAPDYSYYVLSETPAACKTLTVTDGKATFSAVSGRAASGEATGKVAYNAHHADIEISLTGVEVEPATVSAVVLTADDGSKYALHHVVNIWRGTEIGWNLSDMDLGGKTITNIRYYLLDGSYTDYKAEIAIKPQAGDVTAAFLDSKTIQLSDLPKDIANPVATVSYSVGEGRAAVVTVVAENVPVTNGVIVLPQDTAVGTDYSVSVVSDNYADIAVTASRIYADDNGKGTWTWASDAIYACTDLGLVNGYPNGKFGPDEDLTRAQFVTMLYRMAGAPAVQGVNPFTDATASWYQGAIVWAVENGITNGVSATSFNPDAALTRQEMATFLFRYFRSFAPSADLKAFSDADQVADWAVDGMAYCVKAGLINGMGNHTLSPETTATRAQAAAVLVRSQSAADSLQIALNGSYVELFPEMTKEKYVPVWTARISQYVQDEAAIQEIYQMLTQSCMQEPYGQAAIDLYGDGSEGFGFNCYFLEGVAKFTMDGTTISGVDKDGKEIFSHNYYYLEDQQITYYGEPMPATMHVYKTDDADAGAFTYFCFGDDTPVDTYHIEFRYGAEREGLAAFTEGSYAYWNAAGMLSSYDDAMMTNCINLFVDENLAEMMEEPAA